VTSGFHRWPALAKTMLMLPAIALSTTALAQDDISILADDANGRYSLAPIDGGIAKLDTRTGAITECRRKDDALTCALVPDERQRLQGEIDRLTRENAELRAKSSGTPPTGSIVKPAPALPSDEEVDRALSLMERFLRRFKEIMREGNDSTRL
jgi:hypothetical protein